MSALLLRCVAISGLLAVALGALGAHYWAGHLDARAMAAYQTAVTYQFIHTLALLGVTILLLLRPQLRALKWCAGWFLTGLVLFCGSLYLLALGGPRWLGPVTPVGGLSLMLGWLTLIWVATDLKQCRSE